MHARTALPTRCTHPPTSPTTPAHHTHLVAVLLLRRQHQIAIGALRPSQPQPVRVQRLIQHLPWACMGARRVGVCVGVCVEVFALQPRSPSANPHATLPPPSPPTQPRLRVSALCPAVQQAGANAAGAAPHVDGDSVGGAAARRSQGGRRSGAHGGSSVSPPRHPLDLVFTPPPTTAPARRPCALPHRARSLAF